jgi:hypothetical protein
MHSVVGWILGLEVERKPYLSQCQWCAASASADLLVCESREDVAEAELELAGLGNDDEQGRQRTTHTSGALKFHWADCCRCTS